jgi:hypothetical protein
MATAEIPLSPEPQQFSIRLAGTEYLLQLQWRGFWTLNILRPDQTPVINGIPLVTGVDLLYQYRYLGIGGGLTVQTDGDKDAVPTLDNLGTASHLYFVTP